MTIYEIKPNRETLHGSFSVILNPILNIQSGDTVSYSTMDARWGYSSETDQQRLEFPRREGPIDSGHALCGPVYLEGAKLGMVLEVRIQEIIPGPYGFSLAGERANWQNKKLDLMKEKEIRINYSLDKV